MVKFAISQTVLTMSNIFLNLLAIWCVIFSYIYQLYLKLRLKIYGKPEKYINIKILEAKV